MITAQQARELSGPTSEEYALFFEEAIKEAAAKGERKICKYHGTLENAAYSHTKKWTDFVEYMKTLGYSVSLFYEERQFVDMRINISW
jgi:hypothetical protein